MIRIVVEAPKSNPQDELGASYARYRDAVKELQAVIDRELKSTIGSDLVSSLTSAGETLKKLVQYPQTFDDVTSGIRALSMSLIQINKEGDVYHITDEHMGLRTHVKEYMLNEERTWSQIKNCLNNIIKSFKGNVDFNKSGKYSVSLPTPQSKKLAHYLFDWNPAKGNGSYQNSGKGECLLAIATKGMVGTGVDHFDVKTDSDGKSGIPLEVKNTSSGSFKLKFGVVKIDKTDPESKAYDEKDLLYWKPGYDETLVVVNYPNEHSNITVYVVTPGDYEFLQKYFSPTGNVTINRKTADVEMTIVQ